MSDSKKAVVFEGTIREVERQGIIEEISRGWVWYIVAKGHRPRYGRSCDTRQEALDQLTRAWNRLTDV